MEDLRQEIRRLTALVSDPTSGVAAIPESVQHSAQDEQIDFVCDEPAPGQPVNEAVVIRGWAFASSGIESLGVQVDEAPAAAARSNLPRPDVGRAHPGRWRAACSGFEYKAEGLAPGGHRLRLRANTRAGAVRELELEFEVRPPRAGTRPE
jgi:hypothetical protein